MKKTGGDSLPLSLLKNDFSHGPLSVSISQPQKQGTPIPWTLLGSVTPCVTHPQSNGFRPTASRNPPPFQWNPRGREYRSDSGGGQGEEGAAGAGGGGVVRGVIPPSQLCSASPVCSSAACDWRFAAGAFFSHALSQ